MDKPTESEMLKKWQECLENLQERKVPEGVTCFSCIHMAEGRFGPDGYEARCVLGHRFGGCCKMVTEPCGFYEESKIRLGRPFPA